MTLLAQLQHGRVYWPIPRYAWADFREMVPLAIISGFSLDIHMADLGRYDKDGTLETVFQSGVGDWMRGRPIEECLKSPELWQEWLQEYTRALTTTSAHFQQYTAQDLVTNVMQEYYLWNDATFLLNPVERLQLALAHIEHLPAQHTFAQEEKLRWSRATQENRVAANADVGAWYNLVQDESLLHWYLHNKGSLDPCVYKLPEGTFGQGA